MKYLYSLVLLVFLASCTNGAWVTNEETVEEENTTTEVTNSEIDEAMEETFSEEESNEGLTMLDATYTNPQAEVDMKVSYSLDENNNIAEISVDATTYDVSAFNEKIQYLVGQPMEEAGNVYISGSSLASEAFTNAIKNNM